MPFFSVIIPTYNRSSMVAEAVSSVLNQTFKDFEILVIDDGSTDDTQSALSPFSDRVCYFRQENGGVASARNLGIAKSRGEYICYLDSDDLWPANKLSSYNDAIRKANDPHFLFSDFVKHDCSRNITYDISNSRIFSYLYSLCTIEEQLAQLSGKDLKELLLRGYPLYPSTFCIKRNVHQQYLWDPGVLKSEDFNFVLKLAQKYSFFYIDQTLCTVRVHDSNKSSDFLTKNAVIIGTMRAVRDLYESNDQKHFYNLYIAKKHLSNMTHYREVGLYKKSIEQLVSALCYKNTWARLLPPIFGKRNIEKSD